MHENERGEGGGGGQQGLAAPKARARSSRGQLGSLQTPTPRDNSTCPPVL